MDTITERPTADVGTYSNGMPASATDEINLFDLVLVLAKHWKMIVAVPFAVAVITAGISLTMPNVYTAKAMIFPGEDNNSGAMGALMAQMGSLAGLAGGLGGGSSKADLYVTMLKSEALKDKIIDRYKLMQLYQAKYRAVAYAALDANSSISVGKKDGVITIAVDDEDPKLAAAIANAYVEELGVSSVNLSATGAHSNRVFLEERLAKAKADLASAEDALKSFQSRNNAIAITDQAKATLEGVALLRAQLASQELQLANLQQRLTGESQEVKSAKTVVANLRGQIARMEGGSNGGALPGLGSVPELGQKYLRLMRDFKVQETLVELLTKQNEMAKLSEAKDMAPFQVLQQAKVPELKTKPKRAFMVITAAIVSCFAMILTVFGREFFSKMNAEDRRRWQELRRLLSFTPASSPKP